MVLKQKENKQGGQIINQFRLNKGYTFSVYK